MTDFERLAVEPQQVTVSADKDIAKMDVVCLECRRNFASASLFPECPRCHSSNVEVR